MAANRAARICLLAVVSAVRLIGLPCCGLAAATDELATPTLEKWKVEGTRAALAAEPDSLPRWLADSAVREEISQLGPQLDPFVPQLLAVLRSSDRKAAAGAVEVLGRAKVVAARAEISRLLLSEHIEM